ncbi:MAG: HyaD/HybD family hydrogenase maturation endopeptidase [Dehalococcoidia bacterium]
MTVAHAPHVVLGIGNILMRDEGLGVHAAKALTHRAVPSGVRIIDGGTLGIELLPVIEDCESLVLIDAARFGGEPGELRSFRGAELTGSYSGHLSPHQAGASDLIAVARLMGALPERCTLFAIEPAEVGFGLDLSATVRGAMPQLIDAILAEVRTFAQEPANA